MKKCILIALLSMGLLMGCQNKKATYHTNTRASVNQNSGMIHKAFQLIADLPQYKDNPDVIKILEESKALVIQTNEMANEKYPSFNWGTIIGFAKAILPMALNIATGGAFGTIGSTIAKTVGDITTDPVKGGGLLTLLLYLGRKVFKGRKEAETERDDLKVKKKALTKAAFEAAAEKDEEKAKKIILEAKS